MDQYELVKMSLMKIDQSRGEQGIQNRLEREKTLELEIQSRASTLIDEVFEKHEKYIHIFRSQKKIMTSLESCHASDGVTWSARSIIQEDDISPERQWVFNEKKQVTSRWICAEIELPETQSQVIMDELGEAYEYFTVMKRVAIGQEVYRYTFDGGKSWTESEKKPLDILTEVYLSPNDIDSDVAIAFRAGELKDPFRNGIIYEPMDVNMPFFSDGCAINTLGFSQTLTNHAHYDSMYGRQEPLLSRLASIQELEDRIGSVSIGYSLDEM